MARPQRALTTGAHTRGHVATPRRPLQRRCLVELARYCVLGLVVAAAKMVVDCRHDYLYVGALARVHVTDCRPTTMTGTLYSHPVLVCN